MSQDSTSSPGLIESARQLGRSLIGGVQDRVTLLALELEEEKLRLVQLFIWASFMIFASVMAVTFATLLVLYLCRDGSLLPVFAGFALLYAIGAVALGWNFRRILRAQPRPLADTLEELANDTRCFPPRN